MIPNYYECEFCSATFVNKKNLKKHNCKYKKRYLHIKTNRRGLSAFNYYKKWLSISGKSIKYVDEHTFVHSIHYNHFVKFISHIKEKGIPDILLFIRIMVKKGISPQNWLHEKTLELFLEEYDLSDPVKQISISVDTIIRITDALECEPKEIFNILTVPDISMLVKTRKISPWLLLNSSTFKEYLKNRATASDREYIQKFVNPKKWKSIINNNEKIKKAVLEIIEQFEL